MSAIESKEVIIFTRLQRGKKLWAAKYICHGVVDSRLLPENHIQLATATYFPRQQHIDHISPHGPFTHCFLVPRVAFTGFSSQHQYHAQHGRNVLRIATIIS